MPYRGYCRMLVKDGTAAVATFKEEQFPGHVTAQGNMFLAASISNCKIVAFDPEGTDLWRLNPGGVSYSGLSLIGGRLHIAIQTGGANILLVVATTGAEIARYALPAMVASDIFDWQGLPACITRNGDLLVAGTSGARITEKAAFPSLDLAGLRRCRPAIRYGNIFLGTAGGEVRILSPNGRLRAVPVVPGRALLPSCWFGGDSLYAATIDGEVYRITASQGW